MTIITEWVMQIIRFMLIGTIIELLLPNHSMKKYIHLVVGLLLLIILAKPILYSFQVDIVSQFNKFENVLFQSNDHFIETENLLEMQKKEIQAEQDAYIWNEITSQLKNAANPTLEEEYEAQITDISFVYQSNMLDNLADLEKVVVTLHSLVETEQASETIRIDINTDVRPERVSNDRLNNNIRTTLAETWGLNKGQIEVIWEGGTNRLKNFDSSYGNILKKTMKKINIS